MPTTPSTDATETGSSRGAAVVVDTSASPNAAHRPVSIGNVRLTDGFLAPRLRINRDITIPAQFQHLEDTNRFRNFRRVIGEFDRPFSGDLVDERLSSLRRRHELYGPKHSV